MASNFILQIICKIHQIQYLKRPLFWAKFQKNDAIRYAILIAPEITSVVKPGMYSSLFSAHVGRYCLENLHYCIIDCIHECCHEYYNECVRETRTVESWVLLQQAPLWL